LIYFICVFITNSLFRYINNNILNFFNLNIYKYKFLLIYTKIIQNLIHYFKNLVNALQSINLLSPDNVNLNLNVRVNVPVKVTVDKWVNNVTNFIKKSRLLSDLIKKNYNKDFASKTHLNLTIKLPNHKVKNYNEIKIYFFLFLGIVSSTIVIYYRPVIFYQI